MSILEQSKTLADAEANPDVPRIGIYQKVFNGTTWDRFRNNHEVTPFDGVVHTANTNSSDQVNYNARGFVMHLDITAASGTSPTLDVKIQTKVGGKYIDLPGAAFAQKTGTGTDSLVVYPGVAETSNESVSDIIPRNWRLVSTITGTTPSFTYSVDASYVI